MHHQVDRMNPDNQSKRQKQISEAIAHIAGEFFSREASRNSLITVTRADVSPDLANATVYISVLPESAEKAAIAFAKRERSALREFLKKKVSFSTIPTLDVVIDFGEKNRQRITDLL